ncbi:hypothetical protein GF356_05730 [candidate division GN15 bacterium]|nr:hypothetical protein [candidate division GN15 bacterium]
MGSGRIPPFALDLPKSWEDHTVYSFMGPDEGGIVHTMQLIVDPHAGRTDLEEYARERIDATLDALQDAEVLKEEHKSLANGVDAYECVLKWFPGGDQVSFRKHVYLITGGVGYSFSCNFSKRTLKTIGVEMDRIIESLQQLDS